MLEPLRYSKEAEEIQTYDGHDPSVVNGPHGKLEKKGK